ncbi:cytochrome b561 domain-containing protein [Panicum miliaceum]|uniref:Cytochrome b561 domain-containing protein n=1 Tax=Panicum miliaceum TaxID=4540 RepID=A0A3L6STP7_PANMI|nr:cytochrome b561 domain-containing protein [Panicum miliaceum]
MQLFKRKGLVLASACCVILLLLTPTQGDSNSEQSYKISQPLELTPKLSLQLKLHALLLWSSVGFLMPIGVLLIRASSNVKSAKSVKLLFYCHVGSQVSGMNSHPSQPLSSSQHHQILRCDSLPLQIVAVVLATTGAVLSISNFENAFNNTHQRIGLALYGFIWLQPLIGFLRPDRGMRIRSAWYLTHWLLGIGVCVVGVANVYTGLHTYQERTGRSARLWTVLLTVEVAAMAFVYLFQDRWSYVVRQAEAALGDEQSEGSAMYAANDHKEVIVVP